MATNGVARLPVPLIPALEILIVITAGYRNQIKRGAVINSYHFQLNLILV
jgi:hypothetical protein